MFRLRWWLPWRRGQAKTRADWCITDARTVNDWTVIGASVSDWTAVGAVVNDWATTGATVNDCAVSSATVSNWAITVEVICCGC